MCPNVNKLFAAAGSAPTDAARFALAFGDTVGSVGIFGSPLQYGLMYNVGAAPNAALAGTIPLTVFFM